MKNNDIEESSVTKRDESVTGLSIEQRLERAELALKQAYQDQYSMLGRLSEKDDQVVVAWIVGYTTLGGDIGRKLQWGRGKPPYSVAFDAIPLYVSSKLLEDVSWD